MNEEEVKETRTSKALNVIELKHKYKMEELAAEAENIKLMHDLQLEVIRIKSAEIRRSQQAKDFSRYGGAR